MIIYMIKKILGTTAYRSFKMDKSNLYFINIDVHAFRAYSMQYHSIPQRSIIFCCLILFPNSSIPNSQLSCMRMNK